MDIAKLKTELTDDPLTRGYAAMTDAEAAVDLNEVYRTQNKTSLTASEVLNAIVPSAFTALDATVQQRIWDILHIGEINPFGVEATMFSAAFGAGSDTIVALVAMRVEAVSRAVELGLGFIYPGHIENARM